MSLQVYHKILEKAGVDKFYGNEDKVRKAILGLSSVELSKEVEVSCSLVAHLISALEETPPYRVRVLLKRLHEAKIPVNSKEIIEDLGHPFSLDILKEIGVLNFQQDSRQHSQKIIFEINKSVMERYWPDIKKFENEYKKQAT